MRQLEDAMTKSSFVKNTRRLDKDDPNYGRPQVGGILIDRRLCIVNRLIMCLVTSL